MKHMIVKLVRMLTVLSLMFSLFACGSKEGQDANKEDTPAGETDSGAAENTDAGNEGSGEEGSQTVIPAGPVSADAIGDYTLSNIRYIDSAAGEFGSDGMMGKLSLYEDGTGYFDLFGSRTNFKYDLNEGTIDAGYAVFNFAVNGNTLETALDETFIYTFTKN